MFWYDYTLCRELSCGVQRHWYLRYNLLNFVRHILDLLSPVFPTSVTVIQIKASQKEVDEMLREHRYCKQNNPVIVSLVQVLEFL